MDVRSSSPTPPPPLVGRDRELALLRDRLTAARDGRGSLVLISGEAGIGKTALADALCREAADAGARVLAGHCYDRTETPPYGPWIEIARRVEALPDTANAPPVPRLDGATSQADLFAQARDFLAALTAAATARARARGPPLGGQRQPRPAALRRARDRRAAAPPRRHLSRRGDRPAASARRARPAPRAGGADRAARPAPARHRGRPGAGAGAPRPRGTSGPAPRRVPDRAHRGQSRCS